MSNDKNKRKADQGEWPAERGFPTCEICGFRKAIHGISGILPDGEIHSCSECVDVYKFKDVEIRRLK